MNLKEIRDDKGRLLAQAEYKDGKLDGKNKVWNSNGQLIEE
ncbi:toxin-antitoxin system YwqK family antitoxin, partial [bacterium]|nr:toxin-antitoxin system YwqK family antitoxin [bacterium]